MQFANFKEKQIKIDGLSINYKIIGNGNIPVVLLHGWGVSSNKYTYLMKILHSALNTQYSILILDLPGFGKSDEPDDDWNLNNYVEFIDKFIKKANRKIGFELVKDILEKIRLGSTYIKKQEKQRKKIEQRKQYDNMYYHTENKTDKNIILIGHSFGGRIAIKYAAKYPEKIDKLILTGAAGIKHKLTFKQRIFYILAKIGKLFFYLPIINNLKKPAQKFLYKLTREKDYNQASLRMKEIMKNVLAEDLIYCFEKIKTPTLLIWGKKDNSTPLADGELMNKKIVNSKLVVIDGANHSLPYQNPNEFVNIIKKFIKKD